MAGILEAMMLFRKLRPQQDLTNLSAPPENGMTYRTRPMADQPRIFPFLLPEAGLVAVPRTAVPRHGRFGTERRGVGVLLLLTLLVGGCSTGAGASASGGAQNSGGQNGVGGRAGASGGSGPSGGSPADGGSSSGDGGSAGEANTGGGESTGGSPGNTGNGKASCDGLMTDAKAHPMTALEKPALHEAVTDAEFGTRIVRVTDAVGESQGEVIKPLYSTIQAWNADESFLLLYQVGSGHRLYDGHTYAFIRNLNVSPPDLEQIFWHPQDPDLLYYADGNRLVEFSIADNSGTTVHTFSGCGSVSGGSDPMYIAWDGPAFGFLCDESEAFVYHLDTDTESPSLSGAYLGPQMGPSGSTVYLEGKVYDGEMNLLRTLDLANPYDHASLGQLTNGHDTLNTIAFDSGRQGSGVGTLVVFDLTTGEDTVVIGEETGYPYPPLDTHISAVSTHAPGWVAVSVVGNDRDGQAVLDNELLLANTNTGEVCRIGHHRSHGKAGPQGYWGEPHASISPSATRVAFASDWGGGDTVDTYVVELPGYAP